MRAFGTLAAAFAFTPVLCMGSPSASTMGQSLDVETIRQLIAYRRLKDESGSDPVPVSVTGSVADSGLATRDEARRNYASIAKASVREARLENEISSYEALPDDWDDQGAFPPSKLTVQLARQLMRWASLHGFTPLRSYPSPNGEIGFIWEKGEGYADLSVGPDRSISYYIKDRLGTRELFSSEPMPMASLPGEFWALASTL